MVQWVVKEDIQELGQFLLDHLTGRPRERLLEKLEEAEDDMEDYTAALSRTLKKASRDPPGPGRPQADYSAETERGPVLHRPVRNGKRPENIPEDVSARQNRKSGWPNSSISTPPREIMEELFRHPPVRHRPFRRRKYLAAATGPVPPGRSNEALTGTLERIDFFSTEDYERRIAAHDTFLNFLANPDETLLVRKFFTRLAGQEALPLWPAIQIDQERHPEHLLALLRRTRPNLHPYPVVWRPRNR